MVTNQVNVFSKKTLIILFTICFFNISIVHNNQLSRVLKFLSVGDFISELKENLFSWVNFITFLKNLPYDSKSDSETLKIFLTPLFSLIDEKIDIITDVYMSVVDLKHGNEDVKKNLKTNIKICILLKMRQNGANINPFLPPESSGPSSYIGYNVIENLPNSLLFPTYGIDQGYYVDYSQFEKIDEPSPIQLSEGQNLAKYAKNILVLSQKCGSCLAFSSAAVLTYFYHNFYNELGKDISKSIFIEPYQLLSCANNVVKIDEKFKDKYERYFPKSNGYWAGHACFGGMSPEMIFWASQNTDKLGSIQGNILNKLIDFRSAIDSNSIKLGGFCDDITKSVNPLPYSFPNFKIKHISRDIFKNKNQKQIAETIMAIVNKFGFIFASLYYDPLRGNLFNCNVQSEFRNSTQTYHYVAIAGVEYLSKSNVYNVLIHNSWGGFYYDKVKIFDNYIDCNLENALFVLEPSKF